MKKKIGIMGFGEIGQSVARLYPKSKYQILSKDLKEDNLKEESIDVLHIAIPYSNDFVKDVLKQIKINQPKFVIIESTVNVGITGKINSKLKKKIVVHSPVRGMHPNLTESLKCFIKYIGADDQEIGERAVRHYKSIGVKAKLFLPSESTELNKILSTSYYGICIAWAAEVKRLCDQYGVDYKSFEDFNNSYNEGYIKMGRKNVVRPTLYPPKNGIGGHCVWENATMFNPKVKSKFLDLILDAGKDKSAKTLKLKNKSNK
jgi:UDP-N-acetyl-D-mannosaminuronate dehydrogenase